DLGARRGDVGRLQEEEAFWGQRARGGLPLVGSWDGTLLRCHSFLAQSRENCVEVHAGAFLSGRASCRPCQLHLHLVLSQWKDDESPPLAKLLPLVDDGGVAVAGRLVDVTVAQRHLGDAACVVATG